VESWETARRVPELQITMMEAAQKLGRGVSIVEGEQEFKELEARTLQRPRVLLASALQPGKPLRLPPEQIPRLASQGPAKLLQNCGAVKLAPAVVEGMQRWIRDARFFLQPVAAPALALQNLFQPADEHASSLQCQLFTVNRL